MKVSMLVLAAGRGSRLGGPVPKAFVDCSGKSLLARSLERLARVTGDREILLAVRAGDRARFLDPCLDELRALGLSRVVDGGATRQESMERALSASDADAPLVLVHDAVRPFFPVEAARSALELAASSGAAVLACPVPDTVKRVRDPGGEVVETVDRAGLWLAQTPQVVRRTLLQQALERARREGYECTDEAGLLELAGHPVRVVPSTPLNLKVTTEDDLGLARRLARTEAEAC